MTLSCLSYEVAVLRGKVTADYLFINFLKKYKYVLVNLIVPHVLRLLMFSNESFYN